MSKANNRSGVPGESGFPTGSEGSLPALAGDDVTKPTSEPRRPLVIEALETFSRVIEQTADSVLITDDHGVIEYINPAFEAMTGHARSEAIGRKPNLLRSGVHTNAFYDKLWKTILSGGAFRSIMTNRRRDGTLFQEDQTITPIKNADGRIAHFVSTGRDVTHRRRAQEALRRLNRQLESEAARIGGILHDEAGQFLTAAHLRLAEVCMEVGPEARGKLQIVRGDLGQIEDRLREICHEIHPRIVEELGLGAAVAFYVDGFSRRTGIPVSMESPIEGRYSIHIETLFYRVVQEGLTNTNRHARASRATVRWGGDPHTICCSIKDDGNGFDPVALARGRMSSMGLILMQDRLEAVGGSLTIISAPGCGTELVASAPIED